MCDEGLMALLFSDEMVTFLLLWFGLGGMMVAAALFFRVMTLNINDDDDGY